MCIRDRERFDELLERFGISRPKGLTVMTKEEALAAADKLGYPVLLRPSYAVSYTHLQHVAIKFADLVYNGQWFTPLREALSAFVDKTQETVSGEVKLKIYKGNVMNAGVRSEHSLYSEDIATFGEDDVYDQYDSQGFINLYGLPIKVKALLDQKKLK